MFSLEGKVVVITGGAGLLGREHANAVAEFGGVPVLIDLNQNQLSEIVEKINKKYQVGASGFAVNISDESEVEKNCNLILSAYGKIDCLVNNAANNPKIESSPTKNFSRLEFFPLDLWNQDILVGLTGAFLCSKYYGSAIANNPAGGVIINVSSDLGLIAPDQRLYSDEMEERNAKAVKPVTYSVVKSGIIGLTRYLATYWNDAGVRCNAICPGGVENKQPQEFLDKVTSRIPMGRLAKPDEYKGTLVWMLSDASSYLNGSIVSVDGGRSVW